MLCLSIFKFRQCIIIVQLISKRLIFVKPFLFLYCQDAHKLNVLAERSAESFPNVFLHQPHVLGMSAGFPADYPSRISDPAENILKAEKIPFYFICLNTAKNFWPNATSLFFINAIKTCVNSLFSFRVNELSLP